MADVNEHALVPSNIRQLSPYIAGKTISEVKDEYAPSQISKLASNENRMGYSPKVKPAVQRALKNIQDYPDPVSRKLRHSLAVKNNVRPENIIIAAGSESVIAILCRTFFLEKEEAITADATFIGFYVQTGIRGVTLNKVPLTKDYRFDLDQMLSNLNEQTKMIYIANPNNPTGTYITKNEFGQFIEQVPEHVLVVMDEAYFEFADEIPDYPNALDYDFKNIITLRTFSKAYGLAGFRIGYGIGHPDLISQMMKTKLTFEPTTLAQAAALAALQDEEFLIRSKEMVQNGKQRLYRFLDKHQISYIPSVSNSVMIEFPTEKQAIEFTQAMLEEGVILRHIKSFGLPQCVRVTVGREREMDHFEQSLKTVMNFKN